MVYSQRGDDVTSILLTLSHASAVYATFDIVLRRVARCRWRYAFCRLFHYHHFIVSSFFFFCLLTFACLFDDTCLLAYRLAFISFIFIFLSFSSIFSPADLFPSSSALLRHAAIISSLLLIFFRLRFFSADTMHRLRELYYAGRPALSAAYSSVKRQQMAG